MVCYSQDGRVEGCALIFSCENSKIASNHWSIDRTTLDPTKKKDTPHPRAKEKPQQDSRRGEITFRIKPHHRQRCSEGSYKTLCSPGPRRKEQWPHKRLSQTCLWVSRCLRQMRGSTVTSHGVRGIEYNSPGISPFERGHHYPYHSLASGQNTEREHTPTPQKKVKDLSNVALPIRARPRFPHSWSLSSGSFQKPLILIHQRADRM